MRVYRKLGPIKLPDVLTPQDWLLIIQHVLLAALVVVVALLKRK